MPVDLKPYLKALSLAIIKPAPPWPKDAHLEALQAEREGRSLYGWWEANHPEHPARIWVSLKNHARRGRDAAFLIHTLTEEICHHVDFSENEGAVKARAVGLLGYSRWRAAVAERLLALVLTGRK